MFQRPGSDDDRRAGSMTSPRRGSVLVPVIAAMLILLLMAVALSELFGAQRMQSVIEVESAQAFWIAEAGLWHAAHEQAAISTAVTFAGGDYTVTKSGDDYTATGTSNDATRVVSLTLTLSGGGGGPIDEAASAATAAEVPGDPDRFSLDIVSISGSDVVIESFDLSADVATEPVTRVELADMRIWREDSGVALPTGVVALNDGTTADRTVPAGTSPNLLIRFLNDPTGSVEYTLVLAFTDETSSTIVFTITW